MNFHIVSKPQNHSKKMTYRSGDNQALNFLSGS